MRALPKPPGEVSAMSPRSLMPAAVLFTWSAYALAGAGVVKGLPFLKAALVAITAVYLVRGVGYAPFVVANGGRVTPFVVWSSLICFGYGLVHLVGLVQRWAAL